MEKFSGTPSPFLVSSDGSWSIAFDMKLITEVDVSVYPICIFKRWIKADSYDVF
jgi:hypothetical protein